MKDIVEIQVNIGCGPRWHRDFRVPYTNSQLVALRRAERIMGQLKSFGIDDIIEVGQSSPIGVAHGTSDERTVCARWRVDVSDVLLSVRCIGRYAHVEEEQEFIAFRALDTRNSGVRKAALLQRGEDISPSAFDPAKFIIPHAWLIIQPPDRLALLEDMPA